MEFVEFPKIARLSREIIVTEKIDGTNAQVLIITPSTPRDVDDKCVWSNETHAIYAGSRNRWITPRDDNYGFASWVLSHAEELLNLGEGRHFGEWWGAGIQRKYGLSEKRFSLFNVQRWCLFGREPHEVPTQDPRVFITQSILPECCGLVPILYRGEFDLIPIKYAIESLKINGSAAAPGFMNPEGIVVYHTAGNVGFKKTIEKDDIPKSMVKS